MYPRLALARELLRDDGVIFISIDDNEQANLKRLCDEIFGEGNFIANIAWKRKKEISNDSGNIAIQGEYILIYAKSQNSISPHSIGLIKDSIDNMENSLKEMRQAKNISNNHIMNQTKNFQRINGVLFL